MFETRHPVVFVLPDGTTVVSGTGGPPVVVMGSSYLIGVTVGYSPNGAVLWEAFSSTATVWAAALPSGDVCATGGADALITCWRVSDVNQPPTAVMSATPSTGAAPLTVTFDGSGSTDPDGTIDSYSWNFGDGATLAATNPSHTYTSAGTYTATLTVTDNAGSTASASLTITVTPSTAKTLRSTAINLSATRIGSRVNASGQVVVRDAANTAVSGVSVNVTWRKPDGTSVTQTATTGSSGAASFSTSGGRGTYTLTVNNLTKTGYTFNAANSTLTKSITK
jgi:PKD repeat protein